MVGRLIAHALVYLVVSGFLSLLWVLLGYGDLADLRSYAGHPGTALKLDFWPVWAWLIGGLSVLVHLAYVVARLLSPRYWQRRFARARELRQRGHSPAEVFFGAAAAADFARDALIEDGPGVRRVVVMFTDIAGSTTLNEALGDETWVRVLGRHRQVVRECVAQHGGREVATQGDGFLFRFPSPAAAADAACRIQVRLEADRRRGDVVPEVRVGIHSGEVVEDSGDMLGRAVNLAARLLDVAAPGEIIVTEPVADALPATAELEDRGLNQLKGVARRRHLLALNWAPTGAPVAEGDGRRARAGRSGRPGRGTTHRGRARPSRGLP